MVYANGVSVSARLTRQLESISSNPDSDRSYVNAHFFIMFPEQMLLERAKIGLNREQVLLELRESDRYEVMKGILFFFFKKKMFAIFEFK